VCVYVCVYVRVCMRAHVCVYVRMYVCVCVYVYDYIVHIVHNTKSIQQASKKKNESTARTVRFAKLLRRKPLETHSIDMA
jgi:hypothetical protein